MEMLYGGPPQNSSRIGFECRSGCCLYQFLVRRISSTQRNTQILPDANSVRIPDDIPVRFIKAVPDPDIPTGYPLYAVYNIGCGDFGITCKTRQLKDNKKKRRSIFILRRFFRRIRRAAGRICSPYTHSWSDPLHVCLR